MSQKQDRYGVFWYNKQEISAWSQADFDAKAKEFAEVGINIVMTFSCTHFRWSFYPWWDKLTETLAKLVKACHRYSIRVVEHHSAHLEHTPRTAQDWKNLEFAQSIRKSDLDIFPGFRENLVMNDPEIAPGVYLSSTRQIDGRTGDYARTTYGGWAHCFNNPHFQKAYLDYLETLYKVGIDGIMADDAGFYGGISSCTCPYCRAKFKAETGYDLPMPEAWGNFHLDYRNPVFLAFLKFRMRSTDDFQRLIMARAREITGNKILRPQYETTTFKWNQLAYPFEGCAELWSCVFQECRFSSVIKNSWICWTVNAMHRLAMARKNHIMAMAMFYPFRYDNYCFVWSLAKAWNNLLMVTPEGADLNEVEKKFTAYDQKHPVFEQADPLADAAVLLCRTSLDYTSDAYESSARPLWAWTQAAVFRNLRLDMLFEDETLAAWKKYPLVMLPGATMLSDSQLELLKAYCEAGGRIVIFDAFAAFRPDGSRREQPCRIFGFEADVSELQAVSAGKFTFNNISVELPAVAESRVLRNVKGADVKVIAQGEKGEIYAVSAMHGRVIYLAGGIMTRTPAAAFYCPEISRWLYDVSKRVPVPPYAYSHLYPVHGAILLALLERKQSIICSSTDYLATVFMTSDRRHGEIHLVNVGNTLQPPPATTSHADRLENFEEGKAPDNPALTLELNLPGDAVCNNLVTLYSIEFGDKSMQLPAKREGNTIKLTIPAGTFAGYLKIRFS